MKQHRHDHTPALAAPFHTRLLRKARPVVFATLAALTTGSALADVPPTLFGVNLANGDASGNGVPGTYGYDYIYPNEPYFDYYQSKGLTVIRLPVRWKRIQQTLGAPLYETDMLRLDAVMKMARDRGMKIILDLHDYGEYSISGGVYKLGSTQLPNSYLADLWQKIATRYQNEEAMLGYDIMNEPKLTSAAWFDAAQATITAIRQVDTQKWIYVEGRDWSGAYDWPTSNDNLKNLSDPSNRLIFSAHSYWDKSSGVYTQTYAQLQRYPDVGIAHVTHFVEWCNTNGLNGHVGEYGIPWTDTAYTAEWNVVLNNFLAHIKANNIGGTYWRGGPGTGGYNLTVEPAANGTERPAMSVLQNYGNPPGGYPITVDNSNLANITLTPASGGWTTANSGTAYGGTMIHDGGTGAGTKSVKFTPRIGVAGNYTVSINWTVASNRSTYVPLTIVHAGGTDTSKSIDQKNDNPVWKEIGTYYFNAGTTGSVTISNTGATGHVIADAVKFTPTTSLPASWTSGDIGAVNLPGASTHSGGVYTLTGSGSNLGGTADSFQFARQTITGDCTITARVASQSNSSGYARAGVMIRDGLTADARFADCIVTPSNGAYYQYRTTVAGTATSASGSTAAAPYWVRVKRVGTTFTAFKSADGTTWTQISTAKTITMGASVQVGLAVCSFNNNVLGSATFDNVTISTP
jgi:endoglucanase